MPKVEYKDLEDITKFLDKISKRANSIKEAVSDTFKAKQLSKMIKDKYTEIKPDYEQ